MEFLKSLFESGALTWEQFTKAVTDKGLKIGDLSTGNYVSKAKYEDDLGAKDITIADLNGQLSTRDNDLASLQSQLTSSGTANKATLDDLNSQISKLQSEYSTTKTDYEAKLSKQAYEFAVKEYANSKKFTSGAAKRDFINEMIKENLKMKDNQLQGADDFVKSYTEDNSDAFLEDAPPAEPEVKVDKPSFVTPTPPAPQMSENAFSGAFNFSGVRPHKN